MTFDISLRWGGSCRRFPPHGKAVSGYFDAVGRRTKLDLTSYGATTYQYDSAGNRTHVTEDDGDTVEYYYDDAYQLTQAHKKDSSFGAGNRCNRGPTDGPFLLELPSPGPLFTLPGCRGAGGLPEETGPSAGKVPCRRGSAS